MVVLDTIVRSRGVNACGVAGIEVSARRAADHDTFGGHQNAVFSVALRGTILNGAAIVHTKANAPVGGRFAIRNMRGFTRRDPIITIVRGGPAAQIAIRAKPESGGRIARSLCAFDLRHGSDQKSHTSIIYGGAVFDLRIVTGGQASAAILSESAPGKPATVQGGDTGGRIEESVAILHHSEMAGQDSSR